MGNKKPVPREGRVVLAQVVKLVNAGDCHSSGICSHSYKPCGFESRSGGNLFEDGNVYLCMLCYLYQFNGSCK